MELNAELPRLAVEQALKMGVEQAEAFATVARRVSVNAEKWDIKQATVSFTGGLAVRVIKQRRLGASYTSKLTPQSTYEAVKKAVKQASISFLEDVRLQGLPGPSKPTEVEGIWDPGLADLEPEDAVRLVSESLEASRIDPRLSSINISFSSVSRTVAIANSLGVEGEFKDSWARIDVEAVAKDGVEQASGYCPGWRRRLKELKGWMIAQEAAREALMGLGARKVKTQDLPVILSGLALHATISSISYALDAELVQRGRSFISNLLGVKAASPLLTIIDDATTPGGVRSRPFDAEGSPSKKVVLVESGVIKSCLHNYYTASYEGVESTGHAARNGGFSYNGRVGVAPTNLFVKPSGKGGAEDLASEAGRALLMKTTFDKPNLATGDFSAVVVSGFMVEEGSVTYPVKQAVVHFNLSDLMRNIDAVGGSLEEILDLQSPPILVSRARIAGSAI